MTAKTKVGAAEPEPRPEPVPQHIVCSLCGLDWHKHKGEVTTMTCIELLKQELASRPRQTWTSGGNSVTLLASNPAG